MVETGLPISVEEGLTLTVLKPLEEVITLLCFKCIFKIPFLFTAVKEDGDCSSAAPADRPGAPDTDRTEHLLKDDGYDYSKNQIGKGGDHEFVHNTCATQDSVCH